MSIDKRYDVNIDLTQQDESISVSGISVINRQLTTVTYLTGPRGLMGTGLPTGGSTGQVFAKTSSVDYEGEFKTLTKADVDLASVDDTSDLDKPISTATQVVLDDHDERITDIEGVIDIPTDDQTNLDDFLTIFSSHIPPNLTGLSGGATQGYRDPSPVTEIPDCLQAIELIVQQMGEKYSSIDLTEATALLTPHGFTVEKGFDSVSKKPYVLICNEYTWPSPLTSNKRAWGAYILDMSEPMRMIVEAPHPNTDGNSENIGLDVWRNTGGCIYAISGNNRKAKAWLLTEIYTTATTGTFTLTFRGQTTAPIAYNATRTPVKEALEALSSIGVGKVRTTQSAVNTTNHLFIYLDYSLYDDMNPTDTITGTNIDMDQSLSVDHDADVAHNLNSLFHAVCAKYGTRRLLQYQQHGFSDTSGSGASLVCRCADVILSPGSSNTNSALYALRDSMESAGLFVMLKDNFDTQGLYVVGVPTGGTITLTYDGETTAAITYSTTIATWIDNVKAALEALPNIGVGNIEVYESHGNNGTAVALVIVFAGTLVHLAADAITVSNNSLTGGTTPTASIMIADDSLLTANTNEQGDVAEANGAIFIHLEASETVRTSTDWVFKLVSAVTGMNLPLIASANMPALAEAGHNPSQTPIAIGRAPITGSRYYAANAGHTHPWSNDDQVAGNNYFATRNSGNTGNDWQSPAEVKAILDLEDADIVAKILTQIKTNTLIPTNAIAQAFDRRAASSTTGTAALTSGRLSMYAVYLTAGTVVTSASFLSGGTAAVTPTHQWFALFDSSRVLRKVTNDDTTTAWAANTVKTLTFAGGTYTVPSDGLYYLGIMVEAGTVPSLLGMIGSSVLAAIPPIVQGSADTGMSNPPTVGSFTAAALTASSTRPYWYLS